MICETACRPGIHFVPVEKTELQDIKAWTDPTTVDISCPHDEACSKASGLTPPGPVIEDFMASVTRHHNEKSPVSLNVATVEKVRHFMGTISPFPDGKYGLTKV